MTLGPRREDQTGPADRLACIVTLGCPKNEADSDTYAGVLARSGWSFTDDPDSASLLILNTCAFIDPAVEESLEAVREAVEWRSGAGGRRLVLAGCLPGRYPDDGSGGLEVFDLVMGPADPQALAGFLCGREVEALPSGTGFSRYLRISEGCSNRCHYCTIPMIRGEHIPRPPGEILHDCSLLIDQGAKEIGIVGQDTGAWSCPQGDLSWLLSRLAGSHPSIWFRLYYMHPAHIPRGLLDVIRSSANVVPYLELPVQHASDDVLRRMGRPYGRDLLDSLFGVLDQWPEVPAVRTTVITGYPGETDADFRQMIDFLTSHGCIRTICAFPYWPEEGTKEYARSGPSGKPDASVVQSRLAALGDAGERCLLNWTDRLEGSVVDVLADSSTTGHSRFDAPVVDGECQFSRPVMPGSVVPCLVDECVGADMMVTPVPAAGGSGG